MNTFRIIASPQGSCNSFSLVQNAALQQPLIPLTPNRVRRNYLGGRVLEEWSNDPHPRDENRPEDWIASTTAARNPGMSEIPDEGLSVVRLKSGQTLLWRDLLEKEAGFYLGPHAERFRHRGALFLAKLLDSSVRLHFQGHPTAEFSQRYLGSPWGKFEAYVILATREGIAPHLYAGFQNSPGAEAWQRIILEQDKAAMAACFEPIPVAPGEVWKVPGGIPHALGPGLFMLEVMEPSDWVVRCEFEMNGIPVPPEARFMGLDPSHALQIFDHTNYSVSDAKDNFRIAPRLGISGEGFTSEVLLDEKDTTCFRIERWCVHGAAQLPSAGFFSLWVVVGGVGYVEDGLSSLPLHRGEKFLSAAALSTVAIHANPEQPLEILRVQPGLI